MINCTQVAVQMGWLHGGRGVMRGSMPLAGCAQEVQPDSKFMASELAGAESEEEAPRRDERDLFSPLIGPRRCAAAPVQ